MDCTAPHHRLQDVVIRLFPTRTLNITASVHAIRQEGSQKQQPKDIW